MNKQLLWTAGAILLAACGNRGAEVANRNHILAVGSSTVYPFTKAVAEQFARSHVQIPAAVVQSTGTGSGIIAFCGGVGPRFPDIADASRRMRPDEYRTCQSHGVVNIAELQIGSDGIAFVQSPAARPIKLTSRQVYEALAAMPYGKPNATRRWKDVDPSLPDLPILVYGPPAGDGTHDSLEQLILQPACLKDPRVAGLEPARATQICTTVRTDAAYVASGENDENTTLKMIVNPGAIGIVGYSFLDRNKDKLRGIPIDSVIPSETTIASGKYPGSRPLFLYVKKDQVGRIAGLDAFLGEYASAIAPGGYLERIGLVPAPKEVRDKTVQMASALRPAGR